MKAKWFERSTVADDDPNGKLQIEAFREHLRTLGWVEGRNVVVDVRYVAAIRRVLGKWLLSSSANPPT